MQRGPAGRAARRRRVPALGGWRPCSTTRRAPGRRARGHLRELGRSTAAAARCAATGAARRRRRAARLRRPAPEPRPSGSMPAWRAQDDSDLDKPVFPLTGCRLVPVAGRRGARRALAAPPPGARGAARAGLGGGPGGAARGEPAARQLPRARAGARRARRARGGAAPAGLHRAHRARDRAGRRGRPRRGRRPRHRRAYAGPLRRRRAAGEGGRGPCRASPGCASGRRRRAGGS